MRRHAASVTLLATGVAATLAACGGGSSTKTTTHAASHPSGPAVRVSLVAPGHHPVANRPWPISVRVTDRSGRPLSGVIHYEFLFNNQVVSRQSHYRFHGGHFRDPTVTWPSKSVGYPLTFRVVAATPVGTGHADYPVSVKP